MDDQGRRLIRAPYIDQSGAYPTGCESVSSVMLLQFLGVEITVDDFISRYLEKRAFETRDGVLYGPDPRESFCGSPYDEASFGCYAPVIVKALNRVFGTVCRQESSSAGALDTGKPLPALFRAVDETGTTLPGLCRNYIDRGMPVVCWACINMREPVTGPEWKLLDTGGDFTWISNEHCMLLVGYDEEGYWFNDPYENNGVIRYPKEIAEDRHRAQGMQAVGVRTCEQKSEKTEETE